MVLAEVPEAAEAMEPTADQVVAVVLPEQAAVVQAVLRLRVLVLPELLETVDKEITRSEQRAVTLVVLPELRRALDLRLSVRQARPNLRTLRAVVGPV